MRMEDTICALSTPQGMGAIAVIRISGGEAIERFSDVFVPYGERHRPEKAQGYQMLLGKLVDGEHLVDEVMAALFRAPHSYTGEDVIEINCHGSTFIQEQVIRLLLKTGIRMADPGEYTLRAYINGKMDLSQAEAVADLIASENKAAHQVALQQMRGGFSEEIRELRQELINFASMIELELDFAEEDVEFADRAQFYELLNRIQGVVQRLLSSYDTGNVIKNGVPVAIVGAPNAGKSTLLNALLNEERAIVTEVAGTTRDAIEDVIDLGGVQFRFIDTAGIRPTEDVVESIGIKKTYEKIEQSRVVLYMFSADLLDKGADLIRQEIADLRQHTAEKTLLIVANKMDLISPDALEAALGNEELLPISALQKTGITELTDALLNTVNLQALHSNQSIVTNARHFNALRQSLEDIQQVREGLEAELSGDLLAIDIRQAYRNLGSIIGDVDIDQDILGNIFSKFCIGK